MQTFAYARSGHVVALMVAAGVVGAGPPLLAGRLVDAGVVPSIELPAIAGCSAPGAWSADWLPTFESPDVVLSGTYSCSEMPVSVFTALYTRNTEGHEVISNSNQILPDKWWRFGTPEERGFTARDGRRVGVNELQLGDDESGSLVWYWYATGGETATRGGAIKLKQAVQMIMAGRADGSVFIVETPLQGSLDSSRERLVLVARELAGATSSTREQL
jgi:EpsI family protein